MASVSRSSILNLLTQLPSKNPQIDQLSISSLSLRARTLSIASLQLTFASPPTTTTHCQLQVSSLPCKSPGHGDLSLQLQSHCSSPLKPSLFQDSSHLVSASIFNSVPQSKPLLTFRLLHLILHSYNLSHLQGTSAQSQATSQSTLSIRFNHKVCFLTADTSSESLFSLSLPTRFLAAHSPPRKLASGYSVISHQILTRQPSRSPLSNLIYLSLRSYTHHHSAFPPSLVPLNTFTYHSRSFLSLH